MSGGRLPEDVQRFLRVQIRSIEQLEILLLLSAEPDRTWTAAEVYKVVLSNQKSVEEELDRLAQQGLLRRNDRGEVTFEFSPSSEGWKVLITEIGRLYKERRVKVVEAIYAAPVSEIDEFAKAFRIRKES
jgi:hypothetical protein